MDEIPTDWLAALAIAAIVAATTISVVVLAAVGSIRRSLNEGSARQSQQMRKLAETVAALGTQQREAEAHIQRLTEANRKLTDEVTALCERLGDAETPRRFPGTARILH